MKSKGKRRRKLCKETREEVSRKRKREGERDEDETLTVERCINPVTVEVFDICSQDEGILEGSFWVTRVVCLVVDLRRRRMCLL